MSMSRCQRKLRLIKRMEGLGYIYLGQRKFWWDRFFTGAIAQSHPMLFEADPILKPLLELWLKKNPGVFHDQILTPQFSRRAALHRWLETTGKLIQKKIWKIKA